jgi:hypothetical protein
MFYGMVGAGESKNSIAIRLDNDDICLWQASGSLITSCASYGHEILITSNYHSELVPHLCASRALTYCGFASHEHQIIKQKMLCQR